jgi:hypothetical protein
MEAKKILNISELGRQLTGSRTNFQWARFPKKYLPLIADMIEAMQGVLDSYELIEHKGKHQIKKN